MRAADKNLGQTGNFQTFELKYIRLLIVEQIWTITDQLSSKSNSTQPNGVKSDKGNKIHSPPYKYKALPQGLGTWNCVHKLIWP